ncbi:MAG TPA: NADH:ubiquinone reductase (Na(+)-transporting) subunit C [Haliscomenobacter sp.]|uniref:NADH:ubiquinone reductase (Na(+)-transporting) subunit C n=1 Tax=Haliscomenobacter sp. TaxID=2717303 RepID=UPI002C9B0150|nr:NADH:ubiquinone reductase (Na(+)-transporting) subunit C [Haliscomenobacter sp.]HOY20687.1 NADH:ubiquinone reductase (Na(+)-transporting) subunit C [Haliscomenobacter sp.]
MYSNRYITIYTLIMTLVVSVVLAFTVTGLKPFHDEAEAIYKKRDILSAIESQLPKKLKDMSDEEVLSLFDSKVEQVVINAEGESLQGIKAEKVDMASEEKKPEVDRKYPLYIYQGEQGKIYLTSVRGNGLWDKIWAYVAIKEDLNTIVGAAFGHVGETPGLGAEIKDNPGFPKEFEGKQILNDQGDYVSVKVVKGGVKDPLHEVDGISGATITSVGVSEMMVRGLEVYLPYLQAQKK